MAAQLLLFPAAGPVSAAGDNQAWDKLSWGMTPQQVGAALGRMVVRIENPGRFTHRIDGEYKGYGLAFSFFGNRGLERVALMDSGSPGLESRYGRLEDILLLKYGAPFREDFRNGVKTLEWLTPEKLVQLYYRGGSGPTLNLIYSWRKSALTDDY